MTLQQRTDFSVSEVARQLGIGLQYAYSLIYAGRLPVQRVAGRWRISAEAVEQRRKQSEVRSAQH
jgi:excisionase family DNA binding protein